jgi:hypothetical protein
MEPWGLNAAPISGLKDCSADGCTGVSDALGFAGLRIKLDRFAYFAAPLSRRLNTGSPK